MYFLIYISSASREFSETELRELLAKSRLNNEKLGITGSLLYKDGNVMQVIEGDEEAVKALYNKITLDPRHRGILTLLEGQEEERQFPEWSMAFMDLNSAEAIANPGYSDFLKTSLSRNEFLIDPTICQKLLLKFRQSM